MGLRIQTNVESLIAQKDLNSVREKFNLTQRRLSSGSRIIRALDDAAGLAISEKLRATKRATLQNINNAENGLLMLETAESSLGQITNLVIRMKELAVQAASDTNGDTERGFLQEEYGQLQEELERISQTTIFNGRPLLNGEGGNVVIQVGPNNVEELDRIDVTTSQNITLESLEIEDLDILSNVSARDAIDPINFALDKIASARGNIGATEARLASTVSNLREVNVNISSAFSMVRDADMAHETAELAKLQILSQAGVAVLVQANAAPKLALKLLQ